MSNTFLEKDFLSVKKQLKKQVIINFIIKIVTFSFYSNEKKISALKIIFDEKKNNLEKYNELETRTNYLTILKEAEWLTNIRIGENTYSDIQVISREDYGKDWEIIRAEILLRDSNQCQESDGYCSGSLQVHHITPLTKGGTNHRNNLIALCLYHHSLKHEHMKRNL